MAESPASEEPLDEAFAAYLRSCDAGEVPSREDFLAQFPELADDLKELMEAADMIGGMTHTGGDAQRSVPRAEPGAETIVSGNMDDSGVDPAATAGVSTR